MNPKELRMYILVRKDLNMGKGKIAGQCGHAVQKLMILNKEDIIREYDNTCSPKIVLQIPNLDALEQIETSCHALGILTTKIMDAGRTQIEAGTITVLGIGPIRASQIPDFISNLKLL